MMTLLVLLTVGLPAAPTDASPFVPEPSVAAALPENPLAAGTIRVELSSGQVYQAEIDTRTDEDQLQLLWRRGPMTLRRAIAWDDVAHAEVAGQQLAGTEFQQLVARVRREFPRPVPTSPGMIMLTSSAGPSTLSPPPNREPAAVGRVRTLEVDAAVGRWNGNVDVDGLVLRIYPLDENGELVPCDGTLSVELHGDQTGGIRPPQTFPSLGQWTRRVRPSDFGARGASYRLEFQQVHPEFAPGLLPRGLVHVRLSVPGQGTFEASDAMVRLRPYSSVRDRLQQATGHRFFPDETTADGRK